MRHQSVLPWIVVSALAVLAACDRSPGPSFAGPDLTGTWVGTITHSVSGDGTITLNLSQRGPGLFGSWSSAFPRPPFNVSGSLSGTMTGTPFILFLRPATPIVCGPEETLTGTLAVSATISGDQISGPFTILNCAGVLSGHVRVSKQ